MNRAQYLANLLLEKRAAADKKPGFQAPYADTHKATQYDAQKASKWAERYGMHPAMGALAEANDIIYEKNMTKSPYSETDMDKIRRAVGVRAAIKRQTQGGESVTIDNPQKAFELAEQMHKRQAAAGYDPLTQSVLPWGIGAAGQATGGLGDFFEKLKAMVSGKQQG